tara:strand:- start:102 stop:953 length:852 start_codon:yes stop_codon:yes gene_type:complete
MPTMCELKAEAKSKGLKGYSKLNKDALTAFVNKGGKSSSPAKPAPAKAKAPVKAKSPTASAVREARNKMTPLELFGQLPAIARLNILKPSATGVKVGGPSLGEYIKRNLKVANKYMSQANISATGGYLNKVDSAIKDSVFYGKNVLNTRSDERNKTDVRLGDFGLYSSRGFRTDVLDKYMKNQGLINPININKLPEQMKNIVPNMIKAYFEVKEVSDGRKEKVRKELETFFTNNINRSKEDAGLSKTDLEYLTLRKKHPKGKINYYNLGSGWKWELNGQEIQT